MDFQSLSPLICLMAYHLHELMAEFEIASPSVRNDKNKGACNDKQSRGVIARGEAPKQSN